MTARDRRFSQQGINNYVKAMQYSSDMIDLEPQNFSLGTPGLANPTKYTTGVIAANGAAGSVAALAVVGVADSTYGRTITVTPSIAPGNANVVEVIGQDYIGQPMVERFTGAAGATTALVGKKAFYRVISVRTVTPSTAAVLLSIGTGAGLGLPYKGVIAFAHEAGVLVPQASITIPAVFTLPDLTDPATNVSGDPRGTYQPIMTLDGVSRIDVDMFGDNSVNVAGNGGFLGIQQFTS
jgi:hypothetical protein